MDAIHVFPGLSPKIYSGGEVEAYETTKVTREVARFARLSNDFLCKHLKIVMLLEIFGMECCQPR